MKRFHCGTTSQARQASGTKRSDSKLTIADFARDVLRDADNGGMHFREVADKAVKLGFHGRKGSGGKNDPAIVLGDHEAVPDGIRRPRGRKVQTQMTS